MHIFRKRFPVLNAILMLAFFFHGVPRARGNDFPCLAPKTVLPSEAGDEASPEILWEYAQKGSSLPISVNTHSKREWLRDQVQKTRKTGSLSILSRPEFILALLQDIGETFARPNEKETFQTSKWRVFFLALTLSWPNWLKIVIGGFFERTMPIKIIATLVSLIPMIWFPVSPLVVWSLFSLYQSINTLIEFRAQRGNRWGPFILLNSEKIQENAIGKNPRPEVLWLRVLIHEFFHQVPGYRRYWVQETFTLLYLNLLIEDLKPEDLGKKSQDAFLTGERIAKTVFRNRLRFPGRNPAAKIQILETLKNMENLSRKKEIGGPKYFRARLDTPEIYYFPGMLGAYLGGLYQAMRRPGTPPRFFNVAEAFIVALSQSYFDQIRENADQRKRSFVTPYRNLSQGSA